jgi:hypothetical protein
MVIGWRPHSKVRRACRPGTSPSSDHHDAGIVPLEQLLCEGNKRGPTLYMWGLTSGITQR